ncbi:uncharacterized protein PAC_18373 [Phialocephala subalpina]|uniref:Uncharacterized protein n=1 Tax=Phialocephala subalpina TaxID=576137 RepID=A0A1L7XTW6_9HELO|nr:uncharacterized protein PAC_18373 [Phialocephala subalpina]
MVGSRTRQRTPSRNGGPQATQSDMAAFDTATQYNNGRDIIRSLNIYNNYHNVSPSQTTPALTELSASQLPPTPRTSQPEIPVPPPSGLFADAVASLSGSHERQQGPVEPEDSIEVSRSAEPSENELLGDQTHDGSHQRRDLPMELQNLDGTPRGAAALDNNRVGIGDRRQEISLPGGRRRRSRRYIPVTILMILIAGAAITSGILVSEKNRKHSVASTVSSTSIQNASNSTDIGSTSSGQVSRQTNSSTTLSNTSRASQQTNTASKSSALKVPTSNTASTTSASLGQILSTSYTSAGPESTCTSNCQDSTTLSSTPVSPNTPTTTTSKAPAITPTPTPKPATTSNAVSCSIDSNCPNGEQCAQGASTCFFCTYATGGMRSVGFLKVGNERGERYLSILDSGLALCMKGTGVVYSGIREKASARWLFGPSPGSSGLPPFPLAEEAGYERLFAMPSRKLCAQLYTFMKRLERQTSSWDISR